MMSRPVTRSCMKGCTPCRFMMLRIGEEEDGPGAGGPEVAAPTEEVHAADDAGGDRQQRVRLALQRVGGPQAGGQHRAGRGGEQPGDDVGAPQDPGHGHPGQARHGDVVTGRAQVHAPRGHARDDLQDDEDGHRHDDRDGDAQDGVIAERHEVGREDRVADDVRDVERQAGGDAQGAERGDERRELEAGDDDGVDRAEQQADPEADDHGHRPGDARADERHLHDAHEGHHPADREVDAAGEQDEGHAEGRHRQDGRLEQDLRQVGRRREVGHQLADEQHGDADRHGRDDGANEEPVGGEACHLHGPPAKAGATLGGGAGLLCQRGPRRPSPWPPRRCRGSRSRCPSRCTSRASPARPCHRPCPWRTRRPWSPWPSGPGCCRP